jgi:hypothetical protein
MDLLSTVMLNRSKYLSQLISEWCRRENLPIVDADMEIQFPFRGESTVGCVITRSRVDSLPVGELVSWLNEVYRVLVPGGWVFVEDNQEHHMESEYLAVSERKYARGREDVQSRFQMLACQHKHNEHRRQVVMAALKGQRQPGRIAI